MNKTTTKWWEDTLWLFQLACIVLYPIGFLAGFVWGVLAAGFTGAWKLYLRVNAEWKRVNDKEEGR